MGLRTVLLDRDERGELGRRLRAPGNLERIAAEVDTPPRQILREVHRRQQDRTVFEIDEPSQEARGFGIGPAIAGERDPEGAAGSRGATRGIAVRPPAAPCARYAVLPVAPFCLRRVTGGRSIASFQQRSPTVPCEATSHRRRLRTFAWTRASRASVGRAPRRSREASRLLDRRPAYAGWCARRRQSDCPRHFAAAHCAGSCAGRAGPRRRSRTAVLESR